MLNLKSVVGIINSVKPLKNEVQMWSSVKFKLNMTRQIFTRLQTFQLNNYSIMNSSFKNVSVKPLFTDLGFHYNFNNLSNITKLSTTSKLSKVKHSLNDKQKEQIARMAIREAETLMDVQKITSQLENALDEFKRDMLVHLSLRTNVGSLEEVSIKYDGEEYTLQELAEISRKPKMIVLNMCNFPQTIKTVLETLQKSQMNLNPTQDGTTLFVPIPKVTKEHREKLAKNAKVYFVKCKDNITNIRNYHIKVMGKSFTDKNSFYVCEKCISALSTEFISKAEKLLLAKQKELLGES